MILHLSTSGGFAGLAGPQVTIDMAGLPRDGGAEIARCSALTGWRGFCRRRGPSGGADRMTYEFVWEGESAGGPQRFDVPESALPPDALDLIDKLMAARGGR